MKFGVGQPLTRKEDETLLRGAGRYIADCAGSLACMRSWCARRMPMPASRIADLRPRARMPGVRLVLTADDIADLGSLPTPGLVARTSRSSAAVSRCSRSEVVAHVGDAVAFVVADTLEQAKDAAEAIVIDWHPLPHVVGARSARKRAAAGLARPARQSGLRGRRSATRQHRNAFAKAAQSCRAHHRQPARWSPIISIRAA